MWERDQQFGYFGYSPPTDPKYSWQPRYGSSRANPKRSVVDIDEAFTASEDILQAFWRWVKWPDSPPFPGGVLVDWPARLADGLAFAKQEWRVVQAYLRSETEKKRG